MRSRSTRSRISRLPEERPDRRSRHARCRRQHRRRRPRGRDRHSEDSDAYRRGLRYDDEIVSFAGRPIHTVNGFKNILGIFPKGWRVPLDVSPRRQDVRHPGSAARRASRGRIARRRWRQRPEAVETEAREGKPKEGDKPKDRETQRRRQAKDGDKPKDADKPKDGDKPKTEKDRTRRSPVPLPIRKVAATRRKAAAGVVKKHYEARPAMPTTTSTS